MSQSWTQLEFVRVVYEDHYCKKLQLLLKASMRARGVTGVALSDPPSSAQGTGGFVRNVAIWLRQPLRETKTAPSRVVLVADADRPANLVPGFKIPTRDDGKGAWVLDFEKKWRDHLIEKASLDTASAERLQVICLRWSKESLLIASITGLRAWAGESKRQKLDELLAECSPRPEDTSDDEFVDEFADPANCMNRVTETILGERYKKGVHDEDVIAAIHGNAAALAEISRRCPDFVRMLELVAPQVAAEVPR